MARIGNCSEGYTFIHHIANKNRTRMDITNALRLKQCSFCSCCHPKQRKMDYLRGLRYAIPFKRKKLVQTCSLFILFAGFQS